MEDVRLLAATCRRLAAELGAEIDEERGARQREAEQEHARADFHRRHEHHGVGHIHLR